MTTSAAGRQGEGVRTRRTCGGRQRWR